MANVTKEIRKEANAATKKKDRLEKSLQRSLKKYNAKIVEDFVRSIARGVAAVMLTTDEQLALKKLLLRHHLDAAKTFALFNIDRFATKQIANIVDQTQGKIAEDIFRLIETRSPEQASFIVTTIENEKQIALSAAEELLTNETDTVFGIDRRALAVTAGTILNNRLNNHAPTIAVTETNWPAEGTRKAHVDNVKEPLALTLEVEAQAIENDNITAAKELSKNVKKLADITYSNTAKSAALLASEAAELQRYANRLRIKATDVRQQLKIWVTMGDSRVRASHRQANGQRILDTQAFQIGSSLLNYPADGSLGADVAEIVHCRCYVYYN